MRPPDGVPEIAAATGYPDDDDLAQAIIFAEATEQGPFDPDELGTHLGLRRTASTCAA